MAYSRVIRTGNGSTNQFVVNFALGYLDEGEVTCQVGDEVDGSGDPIYRDVTFLSESLVEISGTVPADQERVVFERTVEKEDTVVHFSDGDVMDEYNLDIAFKQILMVVHEVLDGRFSELDSDLDLGGFQITNVADPVDDTDVATKQYVDNRITTNDTIVAAAEAARDAAQSSASTAESHSNNSSTYAASASASATSAAASAASVENLVENFRGGLVGQFLYKNSAADFDYSWANLTGGGDMISSMYDPQDVNGDAFDLSNMTGNLPTTQITGTFDMANITGDLDYSRLDNIPSEFTPASHSHVMADITDLGSMAMRNLTISTEEPSGGSDGDVWFKI